MMSSHDCTKQIRLGGRSLETDDHTPPEVILLILITIETGRGAGLAQIRAIDICVC